MLPRYRTTAPPHYRATALPRHRTTAPPHHRVLRRTDDRIAGITAVELRLVPRAATLHVRHAVHDRRYAIRRNRINRRADRRRGYGRCRTNCHAGGHRMVATSVIAVVPAPVAIDIH